MDSQVLGNRYELIEKIGGGGMAVVYKARCKLLNRFVAVKILRDEFTDDEEFVKRFRIEAQAAASLSHPNIVSIFDVGHEKNMHYLVMEYVDGITLKEYITQKGALGWKEAAGIAIQICSAIEQAHKNHIIHRDIKPHNILLTKEGIAKVTDFGIARAVSSSTITMVGSTIGSVHYFSPEQARGSFTDEKSDLYSLGITIYEMVTGKVPFDGDTPVAVALKHIQNQADQPMDVNPGVPRGVNQIIMKAIKKDQNLRYQSASELLADLQRVLREPNRIFGSSKDSIEVFPTKKLQAVGDLNYNRSDDISDDETSQHVKNMKKKKWAIRIGIIAMSIAICSAAVYAGYRIVISIMPDAPKGFIIEDYKDKDFFVIRDELQKENIEVMEDKRVFSDTVGKDVIISQNVTPGQPLKPGSIIKFEVSDGPEMVTIPDVALKESRIAEANLKDLKLQVETKSENNETVATGLVIRTEPAALEKVKPESTVTIIESLGPVIKQVKTPSLIGLTRVEAEKLINASKLAIGKISPPDVISDVAKITGQFPLANAMADEGSPVDLFFDVAGTATPGVVGQDTSGGNPGGTVTPAVKKIPWNITLDDPKKYGDQVQVYIESTPSDTNKSEIVMNKLMSKSSFPFVIDIPASGSGTTHLIVKLDTTLAVDIDF